MHTTYVLVLEKKTSSPVVLKKETIFMKRGIYMYVGSAKRGMHARLARHVRKEKKLFWHIDYVTSRPDVTVKVILLSPGKECATLREISDLGVLFGRRLGASDCTCPSHFIYVPGKRLRQVMGVLAKKGYTDRVELSHLM
jgi:sugar fermentation stimulation protein A